jgi:hypothetical protein
MLQRSGGVKTQAETATGTVRLAFDRLAHYLERNDQR